ncbi:MULTISPECIES: ABC transporter ATP-binding protein [Bradyrhizobium]|uniref:Glycerol-3-phosphate transporter subunit ATP-binding component of ABC superfamily n=1 Tax=Bradyrhizobium vignae TaxID=1549949 RepID=A0A2U3PTK3_9BRAD|nr:sn-glycerol-3-phosphate ABC transporter ATP-binding protein UgpC [Bradyrhizobium vignae]MBP0115256.1 sn-glycerol-3-phosphate ABC transporter ATP-binding protein UgpC [Bradyrhizobium vignae]SPP92456.1 glycerol-3-phosphate transporter subunit; ATP-binding component of ABC superfamily [Bradyrhizobium vignae]
MAKLSLSGLRKSYAGKQVLHGVDVEIDQGEFVVIVGPSGCGKSTLLRMIAGLEEITEGEIAINGQVVNDLDPADRGCTMVFQNYALYPHMTVAENIAYPLKIARVPKPERERRVREAAAIVDLSDYLDRRPAQLSGGQRQRVAMGRAIVREPQLFLFDEPLSNLDAKLRVSMRIEIKRLHKRLQATSIFVTHDQVEAMTLADTLIVMNGGRVEQIGAPAEIYDKPASTFVAGFMGAPAMNLLPATVSGPGRVTLDGIPDSSIQIEGYDVAPGTKVVLGIRPEDLVIDAGGADSSLSGAVDLVEELGSSRAAYCSVGPQELAVILPKGFALDRSGAIGLAVPPKAVHLFDAATGRRLESMEGQRSCATAMNASE